MIFTCLTALYRNQDNFQIIRRLFWQVYLETLWNSANLPKNHMPATDFKADYDKTSGM